MHLIPRTRYTNKVIIFFSEISYTKCTCGFRVYQIWKLICSAKFVWLITEFAWFIHVSLLEIKCLAPEFGNCCGWMIVRVFHCFGGDEWHDLSLYDVRFLSDRRRSTIYGQSEPLPLGTGAPTEPFHCGRYLGYLWSNGKKTCEPIGPKQDLLLIT